MNHWSIDDKRNLALNYLNENCTQKQELIWETLLIEDEEAMEIHIQLLSSMELRMPKMLDEVQFSDDVMNKIPTHLYVLEEHGMKSRQRWFEHSLFHYTVAACITLLFLSTGVFDTLVSGELHVMEKEQTISYSDQIMNMTVTWLDQLKR
ncbi:hypothetical protein [Paenibacillus sp. CMAA1364]